MWYGRRVCLNRDELISKAKHKREPSIKSEEGKENKFVNKDFEIALTVMTSPADYKILEE